MTRMPHTACDGTVPALTVWISLFIDPHASSPWVFTRPGNPNLERALHME